MNEFDRTEKITFGNIITRLFQGACIGLASAVPFFQVKDLEETMGMEETLFHKDIKSGNRYQDILTYSIRNTKPHQMSFLKELLWLIAHRWSYLLGASIGFAVFFFIPINTLLSQYPTAFHAGIPALALGFFFYELYKVIKSENKNWSGSLIIFAFTFILSYLSLSYFHRHTFDLDIGNLEMILFLFFVISSFFMNFTGMSLSTILFLTFSYTDYASLTNTMLYDQKNLGLILFPMIGSILGSVLALFLKRQLPKWKKESAVFNSAVYLSGIIFICLNLLKEPWTSEISTKMAQYITLGTAVGVCLLVSFALTIHGYPFFNRKEYRHGK